MTIAGSDNSAGAGIQADLKTFTHFRVHGLTAITCIVAEVPGLVRRIQAADVLVVRDQVELGLETYPVAAMKTGMLYSAEIISAVCDELERAEPARRPPLVVDPVMVASSGDPLLQADAIAAYTERLFPLAALVTPNLDEAAVLLGRATIGTDELPAAAQALWERFRVPFLLKGGHLRGDTAIDILFCGDQQETFRAPFVPNVSTHGTGCTFSAAIAAQIAHGKSLPVAIAEAKRFVTAAIRHSLGWTLPKPTSALNHF